MEPATGRTLEVIAAELAAAAGAALPGTLTVRSYACGKPRCRCHASPPVLHGPYAEWTRKVAGKTITRRLTSEELQAWRPGPSGLRILIGSSPERTGSRGREIPEVHARVP